MRELHPIDLSLYVQSGSTFSQTMFEGKNSYERYDYQELPELTTPNNWLITPDAFLDYGINTDALDTFAAISNLKSRVTVTEGVVRFGRSKPLPVFDDEGKNKYENTLQGFPGQGVMVRIDFAQQQGEITIDTGLLKYTCEPTYNKNPSSFPSELDRALRNGFLELLRLEKMEMFRVAIAKDIKYGSFATTGVTSGGLMVNGIESGNTIQTALGLLGVGGSIVFGSLFWQGDNVELKREILSGYFSDAKSLFDPIRHLRHYVDGRRYLTSSAPVVFPDQQPSI